MIYVIGDFLLDRTLNGKASRLSPEAPTPVVLQQEEQIGLGGAGNVFMNCQSLCQESMLFTVLGSNAAKYLPELSTFSSRGIFFVTDANYKTPVKTRICASGQQLVRVDDEIPGAKVSEAAANQIISNFVARIRCAKAIVVSDYAKGLFNAERAAQVLQAATVNNVPVLVDAKPQQYAHWRGASLCKPNRDEAIAVAENDNFVHPALWSTDRRDAGIAAAQHIIDRYCVGYVVLTQGEDGAAVVYRAQQDYKLKEFKAEPKRVYDVTGAGDSFMAALAVGVVRGLDVFTATQRAVWAGALAVQQRGVAQIKSTDWEDAWRLAEGPTGKILTVAEAAKYVADQRRHEQKVVLTNGCFDVLHAGHLQTLRYGTRYGKLLVAVNTDTSVRALKGPDRPMTTENLRLMQLASLPFVDRVFLFDGDMEAVVRAINPNYLLKGGDYTPDSVVGADYVKSIEGQVLIAPYAQGLSTTRYLQNAPSVTAAEDVH